MFVFDTQFITSEMSPVTSAHDTSTASSSATGCTLRSYTKFRWQVMGTETQAGVF